MAREQKLALIVGFSITLLVGILLTDHLSRARTLRLEGIAESEGPALVNVTQRSALSPPQDETLARRAPGQQTPARRINETPDPRGRDSAPEPLSRPGSTRHNLDDEGEIAASLALADPAVEPAPVLTPVLTMGDPVDHLVGPPASGESTLGATMYGPLIADPLEPARAPEWYTVKKNESLYMLCERFYGSGMLYPKLIAHNKERVGPEGQLREGVRIQIPHPSVIVGPGASFRTSPSGETKAGKGMRDSDDKPAQRVETRTYRVAKGDCLSIIAQRELGTVRRQKDILALNDLKSPDDVRQGMTLILPVN